LTNWRLWFKLLIVVLVLAGIGFLVTSNFFKIDQVDCQVNNTPCRAELWSDLLSASAGRNLLFLSTKKLTEELLAKNPDFADLKIEKQLPSGLRIHVSKRKSTVAVKLNGDYYLADEQGVLLSKEASAGDYPVVIPDTRLDSRLGESLKSDRVLKAIDLLTGSLWRLMAPETATVVSDHMIKVTYADKVEAFFSVTKNTHDQLDSLHFILKRSKMEGSRLKQVDLRFDKPVLID
jgi:cell division septal protein FtsQ